MVPGTQQTPICGVVTYVGKVNDTSNCLEERVTRLYWYVFGSGVSLMLLMVGVPFLYVSSALPVC